MLNKLIPISHLIIGNIYSFYAFIFPQNVIYDFLYYILLICLQLSWIYFNHECPISYLYKKLYYKNYTCGDTTTLDDMKELSFNKNKNNKNYSDDLGYNILTIILILSILIVNYRSRIANMYVVIFILIIVRFFYLLFNNAAGFNTKKSLGTHYKYLKKIYDDYNIKQIHNQINRAIIILIILFLIYIIYNNRKILLSTYFKL
jgi:hypothetical protein